MNYLKAKRLADPPAMNGSRPARRSRWALIALAMAATGCSAMGSEAHNGASGDARPATPDLLAHVLTTDQLRKQLVGNTISGEYLDGDGWAEFYAPDGWLRGMDQKSGRSEGRYAFHDDMVCFDYEGTRYDWCTQISVIGEDVAFIWKGMVDTSTRNRKLLPGNASSL
jgi:hypothetical protein